MLLNLFGNGFYAANKRKGDGAGSDHRPALKAATHDLGEAIEIRVRDNGTGIAPEVRDKFQSFFTNKPTGEGTGLGLSISWDIVTQRHGGTITVDSVRGEFPCRAAGKRSCLRPRNECFTKIASHRNARRAAVRW